MKSLQTYTVGVLMAFLLLPLIAFAQDAAPVAEQIDLWAALAVLKGLWPSLTIGAKVLFSSVLAVLTLPRIVRATQPFMPISWTWDDKLLAGWGKFGKFVTAFWNEIVTGQQPK